MRALGRASGPLGAGAPSSFPNSGLGTPLGETLFPACAGPKRSFGAVRSQTEFGNEKNENSTAMALGHAAFYFQVRVLAGVEFLFGV